MVLTREVYVKKHQRKINGKKVKVRPHQRTIKNPDKTFEKFKKQNKISIEEVTQKSMSNELAELQKIFSKNRDKFLDSKVKEKLQDSFTEAQEGIDDNDLDKAEFEMKTIREYLNNIDLLVAYKYGMEDFDKGIKEAIKEMDFAKDDQDYPSTMKKEDVHFYLMESGYNEEVSDSIVNKLFDNIYKKDAYDLIDDQINKGKWEIDQDSIVESLIEKGYNSNLAFEVTQDYWNKENPEDYLED